MYVCISILPPPPSPGPGPEPAQNPRCHKKNSSPDPGEGEPRYKAKRFLSMAGSRAGGKIQNIKIAQILCPEGSGGRDCMKNIWGRRPHTFLICVLRNLGPQTPLRTRLLGNFGILVLFIDFLAYLGGVDNDKRTQGGPQTLPRAPSGDRNQELN